ncbi:unnamed protein product [Lota lota]
MRKPGTAGEGQTKTREKTSAKRREATERADEKRERSDEKRSEKARAGATSETSASDRVATSLSRPRVYARLRTCTHPLDSTSLYSTLLGSTTLGSTTRTPTHWRHPPGLHPHAPTELRSCPFK